MRRDRIFLSYRRSDVPDAVSKLVADLVEHFGEGAIFRDTQAISLGEEFPVRLRNELARAAFVLVVIGPRWNPLGADGSGRLADPNDWIRYEVEAALGDRDTTVIPVLIDGTSMPSAESLPESMSALIARNATRVSTSDLRTDVEPLVERLSERISPIGATGEAAALRLRMRSQVGSVVAAHIWACWNLLLRFEDDRQFTYGPPAGFRDGDIGELQRVLQWLSEVSGVDADWWRDVSMLVTADAAVWVASDVIDRLAELDESDDQFARAMDTTHARRRDAIIQLAEIARRLTEIGETASASEATIVAKALSNAEPAPSYMVILDSYVRGDDGNDYIGDRPYGFMRHEVSWFVDLLRPDVIELDGFGEPRGVDPPSAAVYRWGRLLTPDDGTDQIWETRFAEGSWFRRVMQRAHDDYPSGRLGSFFKDGT